MAERLQGISAAHPLGTDTLGRDLLSRVLYGGRVSVLTAAAATALSMLLGLAVGLIAGYLGGWADSVITWFTSIFQGLPSTSVMIALAAILDPGVSSLLLALVLTSWASFSRVVRSSVLRLREEAYVEGARCLGAGRLRIITRYLLPNLLPEIAVLFTTRVGGVVLSVASSVFWDWVSNRRPLTGGDDQRGPDQLSDGSHADSGAGRVPDHPFIRHQLLRGNAACTF